MCGIFLCLADQTDPTVKKILQNETIQWLLSRRGPDHFEKSVFDHESVRFTLLSSVLQLRGLFVCNQPAHNETQSVLQWNGQIFRWLNPKKQQSLNSYTQSMNEEISDTEQLLIALTNEIKHEQNIINVFSSIHGPWAMTFWDQKNKKLWVGRDSIGRRSLCWNRNYRDRLLIICSLAYIYDAFKNENQQENENRLKTSDTTFSDSTSTISLSSLEFEEISTDGIYCFDLQSNAFNISECIKNARLYRWDKMISGLLKKNFSDNQSLMIQSPIQISFNRSLPDTELIQKLKSKVFKPPNADEIVDSFHRILHESVKVRCKYHHNVCKKCFMRYVKQNEHNQRHSINRSIPKLSIDDIESSELSSQSIEKLDFITYSSDSDDEVRLGRSPSTSNQTINGIIFRECYHASTAVLFSGGIDSTVLALLADEFVPKQLPIDLLNVAFSNDAPDRLSGLSAWLELRKLCPSRRWNFVSIHIGQEELQRYREKHIKFLLRPCSTVLDDSIGCALWFATRGKGLLLQEPGEAMIRSDYQTRARVLLLGMGADEQLAGYSRHRASFSQGGWESLLNEIQFDLERISQRNLGRDDRITADHGIEARFPFLDENVIAFLNNLPIWMKCNLNHERGHGEKLLLRSLAQKLGLKQTAVQPKRAIQFGSKIVKFQKRNLKGNDSIMQN